MSGFDFRQAQVFEAHASRLQAANADPPAKVVHDRAQVLDQPRFLVVAIFRIVNNHAARLAVVDNDVCRGVITSNGHTLTIDPANLSINEKIAWESREVCCSGVRARGLHGLGWWRYDVASRIRCDKMHAFAATSGMIA